MHVDQTKIGTHDRDGSPWEPIHVPGCSDLVAEHVLVVTLSRDQLHLVASCMTYDHLSPL
jgi:hypothetical protein